MAKFHEGEVWFVGFPLEEDPNVILNRPVVVLDEDKLGVLYVSTMHDVQEGKISRRLFSGRIKEFVVDKDEDK